MNRGWVLALALGSCAAPGPTPADIAGDRSTTTAGTQAAAVSVTSAYDGFYVGSWTPAPGECAGAGPITRTLQVETLLASSGVNYPLRGLVQPDGAVSLSYGKSTLIGRFDANGAFRGKANTGKTCAWDVTMTRQPPIASMTPDSPLPASVVNQDEVPQFPAAAARSVGPPPAASSKD